MEPSLESALQFVGAHVPELRAGTGLRIRSVEGGSRGLGSAGTKSVAGRNALGGLLWPTSRRSAARTGQAGEQDPAVPERSRMFLDV